MTKTLAEKITRETKAFKKMHGKNWAIEYFNNFYGNLPGGYRRRLLESAPELKNMKKWDKGSSKSIEKQTVSEFFETIDRVINEMELDVSEIVAIQNNTTLNSVEKYSNLYDMILPVYTKLREMGYKHYPDLTA